MSFKIGSAFVEVGLRTGGTIAGLAALTTAATVAGGALAALPALAGSVSGIGGVLVGAFSGVGDALKGYRADQDAAASATGRSAAASAASARQIRDAQRSVDDARRNAAKVARDSGEAIARAERNAAEVAADVADRINDAKQDQRRVAEDVADAISDAQENQARTARSGAEAQEAASRKIARALEDEVDAQADLVDAREKAAEQLEDLREQVRDYALDQEGAAIRILKAEERLSEVRADESVSALDLRDALYDLDVAKERQRDLTREQTEASAELAEQERAGVNGSKLVLSAQEKLADAQQKTADAQRDAAKVSRDASEANQKAAEKTAEVVEEGARKQADAAEKVADAQREGAAAQREAAEAVTQAQRDGAEAQADAARQVQDALQNLADAQAQANESMASGTKRISEYAKAMANLTPEGRAFVKQLQAMGPLVRGLRDASQESFLPGLTSMLRDSEGLFPIFEEHLRRTGGIMSDVALDFGDMFKSDEFKSNLNGMFKASEPITKAIGRMFLETTKSIVRTGSEMTGASRGFAAFLDGVTDGLSGFFREMEPYDEDFERAWSAIGRIFRVLLPAVGEMLGKLAEDLAPIFENIASFMEDHEEELDGWLRTILNFYLALKGAQVAIGVGKMVAAVIAGWNKLPGAAKKVMGLVGATGLVLYGAAKLTGEDQFAADLEKLGSGDLSPITQPIEALGRGDISGAMQAPPPIPGDLNDFRNWGAFFSGEDGQADIINNNVNGWLEGIVGNITGWFKDLPNNIGQFFTNMKDGALFKLGEFRDSAGLRAMELRDRVTRFFSELPGRVGGFFIDMRDRAVARLVEFRDGAGLRAIELRDRVTNFLSGLPGRIGGFFIDMRDRAVNRFIELRDSAGTRAIELRDRITNFLSGLPGRIGGFFIDLRDRVVNRFIELRNSAGSRAIELRDNITNFLSGLPGRIGGFFIDLKDRALARMAELRNTAGTRVRELADGIMNGIRSLPDRVNEVFNRMKNWAIDRLNDLKNLARQPIDFVVNTVYGNGIKPMWNNIAGVFGMRRLATGGILPGYTPGRDVHMAALSGGEAVMRPEWTRAAGASYVHGANKAARIGGITGAASYIRTNGLPGYADGGIIGDVWSRASGFINNLFSGSPAAAVRKMFEGVLGDSGRAPGQTSSWKDASQRVAPQTVGAIIEAAKKWMSGSGGGGSFGRGLAWARTQHGKAYQWGGAGNPSWDCSGFLGAISRVIRGQAPGRIGATGNFPEGWPGWRPGAASPFTIGSFRGNPGHMAGTLLGVNVESAGGGKGVRVGSSARGSSDRMFRTRAGLVLDNGGMLPSGMAAANFSGRPERMLSPQQTASFDRLVDWLDSNASSNSGRAGGDVHVHLEQTSGSPAETGRFVALSLRGIG